MSKKQNIFWFLIVLPIGLAYVYNLLFESAGNWLEDNAVSIETILLVISVLGSVWLLIKSIKDKNTLWIIFSSILLIGILIFSYLNIALFNTSIG
jgi:hypothetical protein